MRTHLAASIITAMTALAGCTTLEPTDEGPGPVPGGGKEDSGISQDNPVRIRYATWFGPHYVGTIDIFALGHRDVTIQWRSEGPDGELGEWHEAPATFLAVIDESRPDHQLWGFRGVGDGPGRIELRARYQSTQGEYFSPVATATTLSSPLGAGLDVAAIDATVTDVGLDIDLVVRNIAFEKDVAVVYTMDDWDTYDYAPATYLFGDEVQKGERWNAQIAVPPGVTAIEYAVRSTQNGHDAWDNNFARNFGCAFDGPAPACWGAAFALRD